MKVSATNKYILTYTKDKELDRIPAEGEVWEVDEKRKNLLLENGFVTLVNEEEKPKRRKKKSE